MIVVKFLPSYSSQLNPIEKFFSMIKSRFHVINEGTVHERLSNVLENNFENEGSGFYCSMERWWEKARSRLPF